MTTESYARAPSDPPDMARQRNAWHRQFTQAALFGTEAADTEIADEWLRDVDCDVPAPHFALRLIRAVLSDRPADAEKVAREWLAKAALDFARSLEDRALDRGETPIDVCNSMRTAP